MVLQHPLDLEGAESASTEESAGHQTEESSSEHQFSLSYGDRNSFAAVQPTDIDYNRDRRAWCDTSRNANVQLQESRNSARAATCVLNRRRYSADDSGHCLYRTRRSTNDLPAIGSGRHHQTFARSEEDDHRSCRRRIVN